jgi:hypothetical protein
LALLVLLTSQEDVLSKSTSGYEDVDYTAYYEDYGVKEYDINEVTYDAEYYVGYESYDGAVEEAMSVEEAAVEKEKASEADLLIKKRALARKGYAPIGRDRTPRNDDDDGGALITKEFRTSVHQRMRCVLRGGNATELLVLAGSGDEDEELDEYDGDIEEEDEVMFDASVSSLKLSYKEKQKQKQIEREETARNLRELRAHRVLLGPDCTSITCSACRSVVREFGAAVLRERSNEEYLYIDDVASTFCESRELSLVGTEVTLNMCETLLSTRNRDSFLLSFDDVVEKRAYGTIERNKKEILALESQICVAAGACMTEDVTLSLVPATDDQKDWTPDCFFCSAFATKLESDMRVRPPIRENIVTQITREVCGQVNLDAAAKAKCEVMTSGRQLDEISWTAMLHYESMQKGESAQYPFPRKFCIDLNMCEPDALEVAAAEEEAAIAAVVDIYD